MSFDDNAWNKVVLLDDVSTQEGFQEGEKVRQKKDELEGFHLGLDKGQEIGSELGLYQGFAISWIKVCQRKEDSLQTKSVLKARKVLEKLKNSCEEFPSENIEDVDHLQLLQEIRAKYKLVCQLLKIKCDSSKQLSSGGISW